MKIISISIIISILIYFGLAFGLLLSQWPQRMKPSETIDIPLPPNQPDTLSSSATSYEARDKTKLQVQHFKIEDDAPLVVLVHGSGWHGGAYLGLAEHLWQNGEFEVLVPDLRGHGAKTDTRGDVAYIGQLEDDLADLIAAYRKPSQSVYMVGHSSGGGLVTRFAGGGHGQMIEKAVLMAPFLKHNAPTMRENSGGWAHALTRRIIGLSMLNNVGITAFNKMTILQFNFPKSVLEGALRHTATQSYSYRLNTSFAPRSDYLADVAALPQFLLIVGENDDAFHANKFETTMSTVTSKGTYEIVPNASHIDLVYDKVAQSAIIAFLQN